MRRKRPSPTAVLFCFSFLSASTYVAVRALAVSLFLARLGTDALPLAFAAAAFTVIAVAYLTRRAVQRFSSVRCASVSWILLATMTVALGFMVGPYHHSLFVLGAFYILAEVRGCLSTIYMVTLSNDAFVNSQSKRPYAIVASGAPVAGIVVGFALGLEASFVRILPIMLLIAAFDLVTSVVVSFVGRNSREDTDKDMKSEVTVPGSEIHPQTQLTNQRNYRFQLSALVALKIAVLTLIGFQWKVSVGNYFGNDETRLVAYFAMFYAFSDILIFLIQWLVTGKLLDRFGIGIGLIGFPIAIGLIGIAAIFTSSSVTALMIVFTIGKGFNVLRRALHDPGLASAYSVLDPNIRRETIVFVKGMIKPFAEAASASLLLLIGGFIMESDITFVWLLLTIPWFYFAIKTTRSYKSLSSA